jgi:hypothetical protein
MGHIPVHVAHCMQSFTLSPLSSLSFSIDVIDRVWAVIVNVMSILFLEPISYFRLPFGGQKTPRPIASADRRQLTLLEKTTIRSLPLSGDRFSEGQKANRFFSILYI